MLASCADRCVAHVRFEPEELWREATVFSGGWLDFWVHETLAQAGIIACVEISFMFSDDSTVHIYNLQYRHKDAPTNVLSFPLLGEEEERGCLRTLNPTVGCVPIGDILFAYETIAREAQVSGVPFDHHLAHLVIHGVLHLLGYDHESPDEAQEMESLEVQILATKAIPTPTNRVC